MAHDHLNRSGLNYRTAEAVLRGRQLVSHSQALIQEAKQVQERSKDLVESLLELREFVHENRQELGRTIKGRADKR